MNERQELAKILGLSPTASWAEIYVEIGRLKERKNDNYAFQLPNNPNLHYHGAIPCYQNPCVWC